MMDDTMETGTVGGLQAFQFSATRIEHLGATEYTLATIAMDVTGSVQGFEKLLRDCLVTAVGACKKSPRRDNLLLRVILFSSSFPNGIQEIHGFKPLGEIDPQAYPELQPYGSTPLYDAAFSAVGATNTYAKQLMAQDFLANGIVFVVTDGDDNTSSATPTMIKKEIDRAARGEEIESLVTVLVGVNAAEFKSRLENFAATVGMQYVDVGKVTEGRLAKLAGFLSQSVSSTTQAVGTGGPSQTISATI